MEDSLRYKLSALIRRSLAGATGRASSGAPAAADALPLPRGFERVPTAPFDLDQYEESNGAGTHAAVRRDLAAWLSADAVVRPFRSNAAEVHPELAAVAAHFPKSALFLDLETCGFAGSMVFLVGLVRWAEGRLVLEQLLARGYHEERSILAALWQRAEAAAVLVTFNGKSFDWPLVHDRTTRLGVRTRQARPTLIHCDLLHHARRAWRSVLPNCKLQTLERFICRRRRANDLVGADVPAAYRHFVASGQTGALGAVLAHNAWDLVTLVEVAARLVEVPLAAPRLRAS